MPNRKIIHVDMDAFFASVEQRENPELQGKAIAVGRDEERGVVSTASYEARKFGVHSAMSIQVAKRMCPNLIIVPSHYDLYKKVSAQVHDIFREYTDLIEPISIDEAFLDVTVNKYNIELAVDIAKEIKQKIKDRLHLTASAGVSYNKFLAKIASEYRKPDGLFVIHPDRAMSFIEKLPIENFWGVGRKTAEKMHFIGIFNGAQLLTCSQKHLTEVFGKAGTIYYNFARGIDQRVVEPYRERKSVGCEQTFAKDLYDNVEIVIELYHIVIELIERLHKSEFRGRTLTLKIKYSDFSQITRRTTSNNILFEKKNILPLAKSLMRQVNNEGKRIRLLGLSVSNTVDEVEDNKGEWIEQELDFEDWD
jgi:DNA polymerase IV